MDRLMWAILALIALVSGDSAITVAPTNADPIPFFNAFAIEVGFQRPSGPPRAFASLLPLDSQVLGSLPIQGQWGNAVIATSANQTFPASNDIVFIPCDPSAYPDGQGAASVAQAAVNEGVQAIVFYSTTADYCNYSSSNPTFHFFVYTMTNMTAIQPLESALNSSTSQPAVIAKQSIFQNMSQSSGGGGGNSPMPSPSTAVAMIILYSITGVITALFLIIIITGAFRAHRHPERYGPRGGAGRPRQSRARGLARAMLDTIPIVKFGERDEPKPNDVEMAPKGNETAPDTQAESAEEANSANVTAAMSPAAAAELSTQEEQATADIETLSCTSAPTSFTQVADPAADADESLNCSICTEDFERGQDVRVLPCNHSFHPACIDPWLLNVSGTCPLCRIDLHPVGSDDGSVDEQTSSFAPPLAAPSSSPSTDNVHEQGLEGFQRASRRVSGLARAMLNPRRMENASTQERIAALRRLRDRLNESGESEQEARRRRRLTAVLSERFSVRTRRRGAETPDTLEWRRSIGSVRSLRSVRSQRSLRSVQQQRSETVPPVPAMPIFVSVQIGDGGHRAQHRSAEQGGESGAPLETVLSNSVGERAAERRRERRDNEDAATGAER